MELFVKASEATFTSYRLQVFIHYVFNGFVQSELWGTHNTLTNFFVGTTFENMSF